MGVLFVQWAKPVHHSPSLVMVVLETDKPEVVVNVFIDKKTSAAWSSVRPRYTLCNLGGLGINVIHGTLRLNES